jgi:FAD:protein FMN transferase
MPSDKRRAVTLITFFLIASFAAQCTDSQVLVYKKKYVMGTVFEIAAYDQSSEHAANAIEKAFQEIVRLDNVLSNYKPDSPLSQLNRSAHFHREKVDPDLYRVIAESLQMSRLSEGKFDISVAPLVNLWKAALRGDRTASSEQLEQVRSCVGYEKIELTPPHQIRFLSPCLQLDLGAIGKGYAVDRAVDVLRSFGIRNALINAGGSTMFAMGAPPDQAAWVLHLRDPSNKIGPQVLLKDASVSTSEQTTRSLLGTESAGHIIDPATGTPLKMLSAVSAVSKTATMSDALSTTLLLVGPAKGKALIESMDGVSAIWISPDAQTESAINGPQILIRTDVSTPMSLGRTQ